MKNQFRNGKNLLIDDANANDCCCSCKTYDTGVKAFSFDDWTVVDGTWNKYESGVSCADGSSFIYFNHTTDQHYIKCHIDQDIYDEEGNQFLYFSIRLILGYDIEEGSYYFGEFKTRPDLPQSPFPYPMVEFTIGQYINGSETVLCSHIYNSVDLNYYNHFMIGTYVNPIVYFTFNSDTSRLLLGHGSINISYPIESISGKAGISNNTNNTFLQLDSIQIYRYNGNKDDCINVVSYCCADCIPQYVSVTMNTIYEPKITNYDMTCVANPVPGACPGSNTVDPCTGRPICRCNTYDAECGPIQYRCNNGILEYKMGKCLYSYPPMWCPGPAFLECQDAGLPWISTGTPCYQSDIYSPIYTEWKHHVFPLPCTYSTPYCDDNLEVITNLTTMGKVVNWLNTQPTIILPHYSYCVWRNNIEIDTNLYITIQAYFFTNAGVGMWYVELRPTNSSKIWLEFFASDVKCNTGGSTLYYRDHILPDLDFEACVQNLEGSSVTVQGL